MPHEQSNRESQEAAKIRESMLAQIYGKVQDVMSGPLADIRRWVVEEPWYGKTIFDVVHERQNQGTFWGNDRGDKPIDQEPDTKEQGQDAEKSQYDQEMDEIMESFYGNDQDQDEDRGMGYGRGMER